jgi:hypothetical protein
MLTPEIQPRTMPSTFQVFEHLLPPIRGFLLDFVNPVRRKAWGAFVLENTFTTTGQASDVDPIATADVSTLDSSALAGYS